MEKTALSLRDLSAKAQQLCARAEYCADDIRLKIRLWGGTDAQAQQVIDLLYRQHYLDDHRYASAFARDKVRFNGWGKLKIAAALRAKHLPDAVIDEALNALDPNEYQRALEKAIRQTKNPRSRGFTSEDLD